MVQVVGLGTQDSMEEAKQFVSDLGLTFPMLWDPGFDSWRAFGVSRQPAAVLVTAQGKRLQSWSGMFDEEEAARLAAAA